MFIITFLDIILTYHIVYISLQESPVAIQRVIVGYILYYLLYIRAFLANIVTFVFQATKLTGLYYPKFSSVVFKYLSSLIILYTFHNAMFFLFIQSVFWRKSFQRNRNLP